MINRELKRKNNISTSFRPNPFDAAVAEELGELTEIKKRPQDCLPTFDKYHHKLTDYSFWYLLSTIWVSYSGFSDLKLWIKHFSSDRPDRAKSVMKPNELKAFKKLPPMIKCYRAHRHGEKLWISYTLSLERARAFAEAREGGQIRVYRIKKSDVTAYFLRRGEFELIMLDQSKAELIGYDPVQL